jgi:hypothetical protein
MTLNTNATFIAHYMKRNELLGEKLLSHIVVRQARRRKSLRLICRLPRDGPDHRTAHALSHSVTTGWNSPYSSFPLD